MKKKLDTQVYCIIQRERVKEKHMIRSSISRHIVLCTERERERERDRNI